MKNELNITADWEHLGEGSAEERACFASVEIRYDGFSLTEGHDGYVNRVRTAPLLSAYHLAEWVAWNWWRLRWEPRSNIPSWAYAHRLATVGEGYVWPNITIFSDGQRVALISRPTAERAASKFRYLGYSLPVIVSGEQFEDAIGIFIEQVRGQLRAEGIHETDLDINWDEVKEERRDQDASMRRKFEALLGYDPDEAPGSSIERLVRDAAEVGLPAMNEVAADHPQGGEIITTDILAKLAHDLGFESAPKDIVQLRADNSRPKPGSVPAWRLGAIAAKALRDQEQLGETLITDDKLAQLAAVQTCTIDDRRSSPNISFALDQNVGSGRVVLRSKWKTGRRFDLARLIGDRLVRGTAGRLYPATRAYTYQQKVQRSFAAELLSPFEAVNEMLGGDYSVEKRQDVADYFQVSEITIRTLLVNHRLLEREELDEEFEVAAA